MGGEWEQSVGSHYQEGLATTIVRSALVARQRATSKRIMEEEGVSLRRAAARLQKAHSLIVKWQQERASDADPILAMLTSKKKSFHPGPLRQLKPLQDTLCR